MSSLHRRKTHPVEVPGCYGCHISTLTIDGRSPSPQTKMEAGWDKDMPAFKRLVDQGYMPAQIDGSAHLEANATTRFEIESGMGVAPDAKQMQEALTIVQDATGFDPLKPSATPIPSPAPA
jgi:hypothetical protein